ncbi:MAG: hypothetical protein POELPBGB_00592 [Bacteroidia bacterium]|nr:hypothetical protein [Bacteroidia bacterium]
MNFLSDMQGKHIIRGIKISVICICVYLIFFTTRFTHTVNIGDYKRCFGIFKDSIKNDIDTLRAIGLVTTKDYLYKYVYNKEYYISIWEFKDLNSVKLGKVKINLGVDLSKEEIRFGEVLDKKLNPEIPTKFGFNFRDSLNVNISKYATIEKTFETTNYKGFYGVVDRMSLTDKNGKTQVLFNFIEGQTPILIILYKLNEKFYFISVDSKNRQSFDLSIIKILNLR